MINFVAFPVLDPLLKLFNGGSAGLSGYGIIRLMKYVIDLGSTVGKILRAFSFVATLFCELLKNHQRTAKHCIVKECTWSNMGYLVKR